MVKLQPSKLAMRVRFPLPARHFQTNMNYRKFASNLTFLTLVIGHASFAADCAALQKELEKAVRAHPQTVTDAVETAVRAKPSCASALVTAAITASEANSELVSRIVSAAVKAAPNEAVTIAESAISASPTSSDSVATVVQEVLGDCDSIGQDIAQNSAKSPERLLFIVEDALRSHENCACEVVKSAIEATKGNKEVIGQIVQLAINIAPSKAAEVAECSIAMAPTAVEEINAAMDQALSDKKRGPGATAAASKVEPELSQPGSEEAEQGEGDQSGSVQPSEPRNTGKSYGKGNGEVGYGKGNGQVRSGKGKGGAVQVAPDDGSQDDSNSWWSLPGRGPNFAPVYLIAPASGTISAGELVPLISPVDPKKDHFKP